MDHVSGSQMGGVGKKHATKAYHRVTTLKAMLQIIKLEGTRFYPPQNVDDSCPQEMLDTWSFDG